MRAIGLVCLLHLSVLCRGIGPTISILLLLHVLYCGFCLPTFASICPTGRAPILLQLFPGFVPFAPICLFSPLGRCRSFSSLLHASRLIFATIGARSFLLCGFYLPPFGSILPTGLAPSLLLLFPCIPGFTCRHSRLFGPLGWRLSSSCSFSVVWLLLAIIHLHLANWAGSCPSLPFSFALSWLLPCHFSRFLFCPLVWCPFSFFDCFASLWRFSIVFLLLGFNRPC